MKKKIRKTRRRARPTTERPPTLQELQKLAEHAGVGFRELLDEAFRLGWRTSDQGWVLPSGELLTDWQRRRNQRQDATSKGN